MNNLFVYFMIIYLYVCGVYIGLFIYWSIYILV